MPKGPQGQKRPADVIGNAVLVAKIATGEIEETGYKQPAKVRSGKAGSQVRSSRLSDDERVAVARKAAAIRWGHVRK